MTTKGHRRPTQERAEALRQGIEDGQWGIERLREELPELFNGVAAAIQSKQIKEMRLQRALRPWVTGKR